MTITVFIGLHLPAAPARRRPYLRVSTTTSGRPKTKEVYIKRILDVAIQDTIRLSLRNDRRHAVVEAEFHAMAVLKRPGYASLEQNITRKGWVHMRLRQDPEAKTQGTGIVAKHFLGIAFIKGDASGARIDSFARTARYTPPPDAATPRGRLIYASPLRTVGEL